MLGTIKRSDNTTQVTYNQHPLYYFQGDSGAGQQNGQGVDAFGAKWFVVTPPAERSPVPDRDRDRPGRRRHGAPDRGALARPAVGSWVLRVPRPPH